MSSGRPFGLYLHVPYCASICGYCDFNTYVASAGDAGPQGHVDLLLAELSLAVEELGAPRTVDTIFLGGGTPTLLGADELARLMRGVTQLMELAPGAEVTTEANPESVDLASLTKLREAGYTRVSLGMQSSTPHVLAALERQHSPGRAIDAAREAAAAGFEHISLDLIYGTPGESAADWDESLHAALSANPDHVSAYALTIEQGTRLAAQIRAGKAQAPDDDVLAERYEQAERMLSAAGFGWYELSNWARDDGARCRHNDNYWSGGDWWGAGPGAHSQIDGERWMNTRRPQAWGTAIAAGKLPREQRERPNAEAHTLERVMLGVRRREGIAVDALPGSAAASQLAADGLLDAQALEHGRAVLTITGRLLADRVTLALASA